LALLHFWWMRAGKNNFAEPLVMGAVVAVLLALRLIWLRRDSVRRP
jgi:sulfoxide reductase heme-binding subunit YedZ